MASVVFLPPQEAALPSRHFWPHAANQGRRTRDHCDRASGRTTPDGAVVVHSSCGDELKQLAPCRLNRHFEKCPSALSFLLAGSSLRLRRRVATALPRAVPRCSRRRVWAFAQNTARPAGRLPPTAGRVLLKPHSPTTAFRGGCRYLHLVELTRHRIATSGGRTGSCVSIGLRLRGHVARACYRPVRAGMGRLPTGHTFRRKQHWLLAPISPYEIRSSGYRSRTEVRGSVPSPRNLTGKPSLTCSVGPLMVELFTARFPPPRLAAAFAESPGLSAPVPFVAKRKLPTPAALKELVSRETSPSPTDGIRRSWTGHFPPALLPSVRSSQNEPPSGSEPGPLHRHGLLG